MRNPIRRITPLLGLLAAFTALQAPEAGAMIQWCRTDPVVEIGGERFDIETFSTEEILTSATGPTEVIVRVPAGQRTELISQDNGFGHGWDVRFKASDDLRVSDRGVEVEIKVYVPAEASLPARVKITDDDDLLVRETSTTNKWITTKVWLED